MRSNEQKSFGALVAELGSIGSDISSTINESNKKLESIVNKLNEVGSLHAASKMYIDGKDEELNSKMETEIAIV